MKRLYLYPAWLRAWHWLNAALFLLLTASGLSLHFSDADHPFPPFAAARALHNASGLVLAALYLLFLVWNARSGNLRQYLPRLRTLPPEAMRQAVYYLSGIFKGEPHPFPVTGRSKFNPLQRMTYLGVMYVLTPALIATGLFLMFPQAAPESILGLGGIWPMAVAHLAFAFLGTIFLFGHLYLATTGETPASNFRAMATGWHEEKEGPHE